MLFVTVGSQKFQFNRLLEAVDSLVANGAIPGDTFAQTGSCTYSPSNIDHKPFLDREEFCSYMERCDVVVTHGGTGAIIGALKAGKKVIAVPRLACYGEHVDDHQIEIVSQFAEMGYIEPCMDVDMLAVAFDLAKEKKYAKYESNTDRFVADLASYIDTVGGTL